MDEKEVEVKIYVLIDPVTLKIRYIGRTKCSLAMRLSQHVFRAKNSKIKNHKNNWIRSLLKINSKPKIRLLTIVKGWTESHELERSLIQKYCVKHDLVNNDDRGEGHCNKILSQEYKDKISKTLTEGYRSGSIKHPREKAISCYDYKGNFIKSFKCIKDAVKELNIPRSRIRKCLCYEILGTCGFQFHEEKHNNITDISNKSENKNKIVR